MRRQGLRQLVSRIYREPGDALQGERVIAQARDISRSHVVPGTSRHRIQEAILRGNVLCVIDREFRVKEKQMRMAD